MSQYSKIGKKMVQGGFLIYLHITFVNPMWRNDMNNRHQNTQKLVKIDASGGFI